MRTDAERRATVPHDAHAVLSSRTLATSHRRLSEILRPGMAVLAERILLWAKVAESRGVQMVADGYLTEGERALAEQQFRLWATDSALRQELYLLCVEGIVS